MTHNIVVRSREFENGLVELSLEESSIAPPIDDEVLIEVHAAPINPFDMRLMIGRADPGTAVAVGTCERPVTRLRILDEDGPTRQRNPQSGRRLGAEGFGRVVDAGKAPAAMALLGHPVAAWAGGMYSRYCKARASDCLVLPASTPAAAGAGALINPLTAQAIVETMRAEGYSALINSASGSNLGRILRRLCSTDRVELINIVRNEAQAQAIRSEGAQHVCVSGAGGFVEDLTARLRDAGPTLGFDAIGGGALAGTLIEAMDAAKGDNTFVADDSALPSKVYIYGNLDASPTILSRGFAHSWSIAGWVLPAILKAMGPARVAELKRRIATELTTVFAGQYTRTVSLTDMIAPPTIAACARRSTGGKHLVDPRL